MAGIIYEVNAQICTAVTTLHAGSGSSPEQIRAAHIGALRAAAGPQLGREYYLSADSRQLVVLPGSQTARQAMTARAG